MRTPPDRAVEIHDEQAPLFKHRYERQVADPHWDTFAYSRAKIGQVCGPYVDALPAKASLLDVGCGTGHHLRDQARPGRRLAGIDASAPMLSYAKELNPDALLARASAGALPFVSDFFDAAICIEVMRYLGDPRPTLAEILRVLRPGGLALVTWAPKMTTTLYPLVNRITARVQIHGFSRVRQYFHTEAELSRVYREVGFEDFRLHSRFFGPFIYLTRLYRPLG
ncbi:MAG: class I SAM-dependent methyltransferase, partial [Actinobacteria bacterium]|nr:class I SAM-dependent methyltransferase [Actinomycetota bacterium]